MRCALQQRCHIATGAKRHRDRRLSHPCVAPSRLPMRSANVVRAAHQLSELLQVAVDETGIAAAPPPIYL